MDLMEAIKGRRSVRRFSGAGVAREALEKMLDAARWAPSWANTQCWRFVVVGDAAKIAALKETMPERNPARPAFDTCSYVVAFLAEHGLSAYKRGEKVEERDWYMFDLGCCVQNFCLAAHAMGAATVIVGLFDWRKANQILGVPEGYEVVCLVPIGTPQTHPSAPPRKPLQQLISYDTFRAEPAQ